MQQEAKKEVIQEKKEKKPQATPWNEAEHARNRYKKKVKGGFKAELAQKKVVHLKTSVDGVLFRGILMMPLMMYRRRRVVTRQTVATKRLRKRPRS